MYLPTEIKKFIGECNIENYSTSKNAETFYKEKTLIENLDFEDFAQQLHNFIQIED